MSELVGGRAQIERVQLVSIVALFRFRDPLFQLLFTDEKIGAPERGAPIRVVCYQAFMTSRMRGLVRTIWSRQFIQLWRPVLG